MQRNINNLRYADGITLMAESKEELKSLITLGESERAEWKSWLKTQHSKMKIMSSGSITSWQKWEPMETVTDFILGGSTITADGDCSHEIKRHWLLGRKAMTKLDSVLTSRDTSQSYGFPSIHVWIWELDNKEGWALNNWCLQTVVLEKTLESPLDSKEIKPVNPEWNQT